MFFDRSSGTVSPSPTDKKRRFSWLLPRVAVLNVVSADDTARSDTDHSSLSSPTGTQASTELNSPPTPLLRRAPRPDSIISSVSSSDDLASMPRTSAPSALGQVLEDAEGHGLETHSDGLPTYAGAMTSIVPVTYGFVRCSPFAMVVSPDPESRGVGHGLYHVSVGVNVWMPSSTVTTIRRGSNDDGPIVAEIELGISSISATVTIGGVSKDLKQVYFRKSTTSSSRLYYTGDGSTIKWKLGAGSWQAHIGSTLLAAFVPTSPRKLTLQPAGRRLADHIMISLVIVMREQLTPLAGMRGSAAELFNYSTHHNYQEE
ncbi:hypothetical protein BC835DRAFT_11562 [Cytidiella melzeri]|nr:hypothetical protein BC835DRAFT_11562 [Cytidiella melzeri]